jgi:type IV secretion system protein VirB1
MPVSFLSGAFVLVAIFLFIPGDARAAPLSSIDFQTLARRCAPTVPVATIEAVARTESGLDPLALHDNTTGKTDELASLDRAVAEAGRWLARGDSVDIGLMQINAKNFPALHMTVKAALDPCVSLAGGAAVLRAAYDNGNTPAEQQAAMLEALSRYNTGSPFAGIMNGYARRVMNNAGTDTLPIPGLEGEVPSDFDLSTPPVWNISAYGAYAEVHGAPWLIDLSPSQLSRLGK